MNVLCLKQHVVTDFCPFSDKDPGGLLLLPEKGDMTDLNNPEVLAVTSTLLSVAAREVTGGCSAPLRRGDRHPHCSGPLHLPSPRDPAMAGTTPIGLVHSVMYLCPGAVPDGRRHSPACRGS